MDIAIVGAGNIGGTLGRSWTGAGHRIWFGVRRPKDEKFDGLRSLGQVVEIARAVQQAQVILLSLPAAALAGFAQEHGADLAGKIVIDATNDFSRAEMSGLALLRSHAPGALPVRAFNALGWENFAQPVLGGQVVDLFYCAEEESRAVTEQLIRDAGLNPVLLGGLDASAVLDGMTRVWFALAFGQKLGRRVAFKLLHE